MQPFLIANLRFASFTGRPFLVEQCEQAPLLRAISCLPAIGTADLVPIDVHCGVCQRCLYAGLDSYVVHPPQQGHIAYELYTDVEPIAPATKPNEDDPTRIECAGRCQTGLWVIDGGSGIVHHVLNRRFAIACGPATDGRMALCVATRAKKADENADSSTRPPLVDHFLGEPEVEVS
jgi:hypothetical protein